MSLPNILTVARLFLTCFFVYWMLQEALSAKVLAALFFTCGALTDFFDGYLARKYQLISNFGKIMDPIADKFLMLSAFAVFCYIGLVSWWMFVMIAIREVGITFVRFVAMARGAVLAAEQMGKYKTVAQIVTVFYILFYIIAQATGRALHPYWRLGIDGLMMLSVAITLISGATFLWQNRRSLHVIQSEC